MHRTARYVSRIVRVLQAPGLRSISHVVFPGTPAHSHCCTWWERRRITVVCRDWRGYKRSRQRVGYLCALCCEKPSCTHSAVDLRAWRQVAAKKQAGEKHTGESFEWTRLTALTLVCLFVHLLGHRVRPYLIFSVMNPIGSKSSTT